MAATTLENGLAYQPPAHLGTHRFRYETHMRRHDPCTYCGLRPTRRKRLTVDHVVPRSAGGENTPANLVGACPACNQEKGRESLLLFLLHRTTHDALEAN